MKALAADIGGTNARFGLLDMPTGSLIMQRDYLMANFTGTGPLLDQFMQDVAANRGAVSRVVLALPGPTRGVDEVRLTNVDWRVGKSKLQSMFPAAHIDFINDFQAAALGVTSVDPADMVELNPGKRRMHRGDIAVVLGAGTGLGTALLQCRGDGSYRAIATEAGHMDFAPCRVEQLELLAEMKAKFGHVSWERLVSGSGLVELYCYYAGAEAASISAREVNELASENNDANALRAVSAFADIFAAYAGNLALAFKPAGGLYLVGGMTARMMRWFDAEKFNLMYADKGRMSTLVSSFAVSLVNNERTGLLGAARFAQQELNEESAA